MFFVSKPNKTTTRKQQESVEPLSQRDAAENMSLTVAYRFAANQAIVDPKMAADLCPSADGSAVRTSLVADGG